MQNFDNIEDDGDDDDANRKFYISVSRFGSSCSPRLEPVGFLSILPFWSILFFWVGSEKCLENSVLIFLGS